ncbi:MAG TPA: LysR family transcriptional regulator [Alphaproteobacteria bacterium]|nr:LysR family transcriptional regulator [Alphaproteobacteria bacterium]
MNASSLAWDDMRLVLAIGRAGTLVGAARALALNHSTVFRRLGALEAQIGVRLFERFRDGYTPTPAGEEVIALAGRIDAEVTEVERRLAGRDLRPSGLVRVTTTDTMVEMVTPMLASFRSAHPEIVLELAASNAIFNLSRRDADVAIRPAPEPPEALVGRRVATVVFALYAAADYLKRRPPRLPLEQHDWAAPDDTLAHLKAAQWLNATIPAERVVFRTSSLVSLLSAVRAGIGVAPLPCYLGDSDPGLRRLGAPMHDFDAGLWLLTHPDLRRVARIRAFMDFMAPALAAYAPLFAGKRKG